MNSPLSGKAVLKRPDKGAVLFEKIQSDMIILCEGSKWNLCERVMQREKGAFAFSLELAQVNLSFNYCFKSCQSTSSYLNDV